MSQESAWTGKTQRSQKMSNSEFALVCPISNMKASYIISARYQIQFWRSSTSCYHLVSLRKKKCHAAHSDRPNSKNEIKKNRSGMHPIFVKLGIFSPYSRKKAENELKFCTFGCFKKWIKKKRNLAQQTQIFKNATWGQHNNFLSFFLSFFLFSWPNSLSLSLKLWICKIFFLVCFVICSFLFC